VELSAGRSGRAARHFRRALSLSPGSRDALEGLIASQKIALSAGSAVAGMPDGEPDPLHVALIAGWRHAEARDWAALAALDPVLAEIEPGEALFVPVAQLRIVGLLALEDPDSAAEAQQLAETLLLRSWNPYDALLHARAATAARRPQLAWGSLYRVALRATANPRGRGLLERALEIARELPEDQFRALREQLAWRLGGAPARSGARMAPPAPPESPADETPPEPGSSRVQS
jgi:hypothetical protein